MGRGESGRTQDEHDGGNRRVDPTSAIHCSSSPDNPLPRVTYAGGGEMDSGGVGVGQVRLEQPLDLGRAGPALDPRDIVALHQEDERGDLVDRRARAPSFGCVS